MRKKGTLSIYILLGLISLLIACIPATAPTLDPTPVIEIPTIIAQPLVTETPVDPAPTAVQATVPADTVATPTEVSAPIEEPAVTPIATAVTEGPDAEVDMVVQFPAGTTGTSLTGDVVVGQFDKYRLGAQANQVMSINLTSETPFIGLTLIGPEGGPPLAYADAGFIPTAWNGLLPATGEYLIEVYTLEEPATYQLEVEILPTPVRYPIVPEGATLEKLHVYGDYHFEIWRTFESASFGGNIGLLVQGDNIIAQLYHSAQVHPMSGTDISGNGLIDLIVEGYSGGAHCCHSLDIFELGATANHTLALQSDNCGATLEDIDGNGTFEVVTCDDSFAYRYCAYVASPPVTTFYRYLDARNRNDSFTHNTYQVVGNESLDLYSDTIASHIERLANSQGAGAGWDNTNKCDVLGLALIYLYTGNSTQAYQTLEQYYTGGDLNFFWADILNVVGKSEMYNPAGQMPEVDLPNYYQVSFAHECGQSGQFGLDLIMGPNGSDLCQTTIPVQSVSWLWESLSSSGTLLEPFERLQLVPEECTSDCRIEILKYDDAAQAETRTGYLALINGDGPTAVQRLNDAGESVSPRWSLRGDLSWERR
ncbi:MAG: hypothetical protein AAF633_12155 [Chloroflexota bacterium]